MDELRRRLVEDLRDAIDGELRADPATVAIYSTDASLYEVEPVAVAFPQHARDVETLAGWSAENKVPLIPRGAGSGLSGGAIGPGVVIDFSRHMNRILSVDGDRVRVQPGVIRDQLNRELQSRGLYFAPDPANSRITTIGGMVGVDAAGSHAVRYGSTRDHVESIECVLSGGQRIELGREPLTGELEPPVVRTSAFTVSGNTEIGVIPEGQRLSSLTPATRKADLLQRVVSLLDEFAPLIRQHQPPLLRNCCGYMLRGIRQPGYLDLARMLAGSEGTLGLFTEMTVFAAPRPRFRSAGLLMFPALEQAISAMQLLLPLEPSACDLMDRRVLSLGRSSDPRFREIILSDAEAGLLVEFPGNSDREIRDRLADAQRLLKSESVEFQLTREAYSYDEVEMLWSLPSQVVSLLARLKGTSRPVPFVEDVAVPPEQLAEFLILAQRTFQKHEVTATMYSHAASGQVHFRPILPVPGRGQETQIEAIARDLYRQVVQVGGSISGEHGDGLSRTAFIRTQYGPLYRAFQQLKEIFDPLRLMNPEKIVSNDPQLTVKYLRRTTPADRQPGSSVAEPLLPVLQLSWDAVEAAEAAVRCNGCGICRSPSPPGRMCPFVDQDGVEDLSPRAKAGLFRRSLCDEGSPDLLTHLSAGGIIDSCFNCKQCQIDCPSEVDIPHLVIEARAQQVQANGLTRTAWLLSRVHTYAQMASRFSFLTNSLLRSSLFRKVLQRSLGIAAERRLPRFARTPFLSSPRVLRDDNSGTPGHVRPTVVYFVDYFANHHDPELAEAFVRVLEHNGFRVYTPRRQTVSGMTMVTVGDVSAAREVARQNVSELVEPAREGYPIVCTEPSATICLTQEYPMLLQDDDTRAVARQTVNAGRFLLDLHLKGKLRRDFTSLNLRLAWHTPCHTIAMRQGLPFLELIRLIPGLDVVQLDKGCTGMAGTFGLARENFAQSLRIGTALIEELRTIDCVAGVTDCSSCRMQMEQASSIPAIHPVKLLAYAYGLMPRIADRLTTKPHGLTMT